MLSPVEEITLWFSKAVSVMGGTLAFLADSVTTGAVAFLALLVNWFYARRRDARDAERREEEKRDRAKRNLEIKHDE